MQSDQVIRRALKTETDTVCKILADAFAQDPVMNWMTRPEVFHTLFRAEAEPLYMQRGNVFVNAGLTGAAMWVPPEVSHQAPLHWRLIPMIWSLFIAGGIESLRRGSELEKLFAKNHYAKPHHYLFAIGAMQNQQGKGVGSALLRAGLQQVDQAHDEAYLESSNIKNNPLYKRFGFRVIGEIQLPESGPIVYQMLREAR